ncbi:hypothetical protein BDZ94DRAFT_1313940 [Collybia nuda]|uniref:Uncharacterized protein n=1 Tax=Collybia nuda TaxID=64659 RepID=A0A9P5XVC5_9AGAR|nr:hypothetical protein BDZ94DRAFT_1313940 [Collybia nuda]
MSDTIQDQSQTGTQSSMISMTTVEETLDDGSPTQTQSTSTPTQSSSVIERSGSTNHTNSTITQTPPSSLMNTPYQTVTKANRLTSHIDSTVTYSGSIWTTLSRSSYTGSSTSMTQESTTHQTHSTMVDTLPTQSASSTPPPIVSSETTQSASPESSTAPSAADTFTTQNAFSRTFEPLQILPSTSMDMMEASHSPPNPTNSVISKVQGHKGNTGAIIGISTVATATIIGLLVMWTIRKRKASQARNKFRSSAEEFAEPLGDSMRSHNGEHPDMVERGTHWSGAANLSTQSAGGDIYLFNHTEARVGEESTRISDSHMPSQIEAAETGNPFADSYAWPSVNTMESFSPSANSLTTLPEYSENGYPPAYSGTSSVQSHRVRGTHRNSVTRDNNHNIMPDLGENLV